MDLSRGPLCGVLTTNYKPKEITMAPQPGCFPSDIEAYPGPYQPGGMLPSEELPLGLWHMMANGRIVHLDIKSVTGSKVDADISIGHVENAKWDSTSGLLTFTRLTTNLKQVYRGYLMQFDRSDTYWRMAGVFGEITAGDQAGWYATLPR